MYPVSPGRVLNLLEYADLHSHGTYFVSPNLGYRSGTGYKFGEIKIHCPHQKRLDWENNPTPPHGSPTIQGKGPWDWLSRLAYAGYISRWDTKVNAGGNLLRMCLIYLWRPCLTSAQLIIDYWSEIHHYIGGKPYSIAPSEYTLQPSSLITPVSQRRVYLFLTWRSPSLVVASYPSNLCSFRRSWPTTASRNMVVLRSLPSFIVILPLFGNLLAVPLPSSSYSLTMLKALMFV